MLVETAERAQTGERRREDPFCRLNRREENVDAERGTCDEMKIRRESLCQENKKEETVTRGDSEEGGGYEENIKPEDLLAVV